MRLAHVPARKGQAMKFILAYIQPYKLDEVREALEKAGAEYNVSFTSKIKLELAVEDSLVDAAMEAIESVAKTGRIGDGKILLLPLEQAVKIRTGEAGDPAL